MVEYIVTSARALTHTHAHLNMYTIEYIHVCTVKTVTTLKGRFLKLF